jgi:hypothetical protein
VICMMLLRQTPVYVQESMSNKGDLSRGKPKNQM